VPLFRLLLILFIIVPLFELYILIQIGNLLGVLPTIMLVIITALIGALLLRYQGLQTLARVQNKLQQGEIPAAELIGGVILLLSGALLLTPGFFTDCIGFLCLLPTFRTRLATSFLKRLIQKGAYRSVDQPVTLDGEFWEENSNKHLHD